MRNSLVLTDETARHPFRATLPPHIRASGERRDINSVWEITVHDVKDFLMAYCACFMAASIFIS